MLINFAIKVVRDALFNFGRYEVFNLFDSTSRGTVEINCRETTAYRLKLSTGVGNYQQRYLQNGVDVLAYNLYKDASFQTIWGDGSYLDEQIFTHNGVMKYDVHGKIVAGQNVSVGAYSDVIVIILEY